MKNVTCVGLCWAMTLGLVAVALGQQQYGQPLGNAASQAAPAAAGALPSPDNAITPGAIDAPFGQTGTLNTNPNQSMPASGTAQDRSLMNGRQQTAQPAMDGAQPRGELGVWMVESGGPGVLLQRVTRGSEAEKAGLRQGDVILGVNGRGAATPQGTAQLIRQIPIGQTGKLTIWRDGDQKQLAFTMRAREVARDDSHQVAFRGENGAANGELASRTLRLEQQIATLTQQLAAMQKELAALRSAGGAQQAGFNAEDRQPTTPQPLTPPGAEPATPSNPSPPPGFGLPEEKSAPPAAEPANPSAPPATTPPPAAEKPDADEPFGTDTAPKAEETKADAEPKKADEPKKEEEKKDTTDSLFQ